MASDWQSADARTVNVGSSGVQSNVSYENESGVRGEGKGEGKYNAPSEGVGKEGKEGLDGDGVKK